MLSTVRIAVVACLLMILATAGYAQNAGSGPGDGSPVEITVAVGLLDIVDIDDKQQRFEIDAYIELSWRDENLALPAGRDEPSGPRTLELKDIWTPGLVILNDRGLDRLLPEVASVDAAGNVVVRQRLSGQLAVDMKLHDFPFDTQELEINLVSYLRTPAEIVFSADTEIVGNIEGYSADGWSFEILPWEASVFRLKNDGRGTPELTFRISAEREWHFYILTLVIPMTLILILAWLVHFLPPKLIPPRIGMASATVFSLIAFGVSLRLSLPEVGYLTRADSFVLYSIGLVAVSLAVTVLASRWVEQGREDDAVRISEFMQRVFPAAWFLIQAVSLFW